MKWIFALIFIFAGLSLLPAQIAMPDGRIRVLAQIIDGDTVPLIHLAPAEVVAPLSPEVAARLKAYNKLRRDVLKAYPYAKLAALQLKLINDSVAHISGEKERKKFIRRMEDQLKARFEKDLKKLTITQGRILIKLVDRETGATSYALVKELRGSIQAFFWQSLARLFGSNLKTEYDPEVQDRLIEDIVMQIERGELQYQAIVR